MLPHRDNLARHSDAIRRALIPPLAALLAIALLLGVQVGSLVSELQRVESISQIVVRADRIQRLLLDMETGQRGYLVGGNRKFLEPYYAAQKAIGPAFSDLERSLAGQPSRKARIEAIRGAYLRWASAASKEMASRDRGGAYIAYFNNGDGKHSMETLRQQLDDLIENVRLARRNRLATAQHQSNTLLYFVAVSTVLVGAILAWTTRRAILALSGEYQRALIAEQTARDSLAATLISIGDGVLVANPAGQVTMLNPVAETLTGWTNADAVGQDTRLVFDIRNEATREMVGSPVESALRIGQAVSLRTDTVLRQRGGVEIPIEDSAAPIVGTGVHANSAPSGVVLVFRDVSRRKAQEVELAAAAAKSTRIAETLQQSLLLTPKPRQFLGLDIATRYVPASEEAQLGGDFFDVFPLNERHVAVAVGDVTGKGLHAASFTAEAKFALRAMLREQPQPSTALARLNRFLIDSHHLDGRDQSTLIALVLAVVDTWTGVAQIAVAGSDPPVIAPRNRIDSTRIVDAGGPLLGIDTIGDFASVDAHLEPGDYLLLMTDGITEARRGRNFFGIDGVAAHLNECDRNSADFVADSLLDAAREYGGQKLRDDVCLVVVGRRV